ncbi:MAG: RNA methyltransferase [Planctomycetaceae bacterium]
MSLFAIRTSPVNSPITMLEERIENLNDPRLEVYRSLKTTNTTRDARLFIAEGPTVVERVLRSGFDVRSILISDRKWNSFGARLPDNVPVYRLSQPLAEELVGFAFHCGVMACASRRPASPIGSALPARGPALLVAGDRITDPENVGALIRIASAFGATGVLLGPGSADPFSRRVLRVSMGNGLFLPIEETNDLAAQLIQLRDFHGCHIAGTLLDPTATPLAGFTFPERTVIVFGNEYDGISPAIRSCLQTALTIPMHNGTDSLNVAISAGIFLNQYRTQRG